MRNKKPVSVNRIMIGIGVVLNIVVLKEAFTGNEKWYGVLMITVPLLMLAIYRKESSH